MLLIGSSLSGISIEIAYFCSSSSFTLFTYGGSNTNTVHMMDLSIFHRDEYFIHVQLNFPRSNLKCYYIYQQNLW